MTRIRHGIWPDTRSFDADASIVLVGSRGSGKRSLGFIGAAKLGRRFITEDRYFEAVTGLSRGEFLQKHGSESFYRQSVEVLRRMLFDNRKKCVIECGMGSLAGDAQTLLREFSKTNPVIHIVRNSKSISRLLDLDANGAERLERADLSHKFCSNLEYYNLYDHTCEGLAESLQEPDRGSPNYSLKLKNAKEDFSAFLDFVTGRSFTQPAFESPLSIAATPAELRPFTYALFARLSEFMSDSLNLDELESHSGGDVIELRLDVQPPRNLQPIDKLVALIRRKIKAPIIFAIDRQFKLSLTEMSYFELLQYGLRLGVEYLGVDIDCQLENVQQLISTKGRTKIIGDYFDGRQNCLTPWSDGFMFQQYLKAESLGCDLVRLSRMASPGADNDSLQRFREIIKSLPRSGTAPPLIAYSLGAMGHISQVFNPTFTPVTAITYSDLGVVIKKDPESLTAQEAMQALYSRHLLSPLHFYIVGASVFYSLSPAMHNAAYRVCGMNHDFSIRQSSCLDELHQLAKDHQFGGAAISHPFKVGIVPELKAMSKHASAIGAVNTLLPIRALPDGSIPDK
jgi:3-dehydroquinate dehydratase type I